MEMIQPVRNGYYVHSGGCENEIWLGCRY
jgi:hypothetical protein